MGELDGNGQKDWESGFINFIKGEIFIKKFSDQIN